MPHQTPLRRLERAVYFQRLDEVLSIPLPNRHKFCVSLSRYPFWKGAYEIFQRMRLDGPTAWELLALPRIFSTRKYVRPKYPTSESGDTIIIKELDDDERDMQREILQQLFRAAASGCSNPTAFLMPVLLGSIASANAFAFREWIPRDIPWEKGLLVPAFVERVAELLCCQANGTFLTREELEFARTSPALLRPLLGDASSSISWRNEGGESVLHILASVPTPCPVLRTLVQTFVNKGADTFWETPRGETPADRAHTLPMRQLMHEAETVCFQKPIRVLLHIEKRLELSSPLPFDILLEIAARVTRARPDTAARIGAHLYAVKNRSRIDNSAL